MPSLSLRTPHLQGRCIERKLSLGAPKSALTAARERRQAGNPIPTPPANAGLSVSPLPEIRGPQDRQPDVTEQFLTMCSPRRVFIALHDSFHRRAAITASWERSAPSANIPSGRSNGAGASPTRSPRRPARSAALIFANPTLMSLAQCGIRPQRRRSRLRSPALRSYRTTGSRSVGAAFQLGEKFGVGRCGGNEIYAALKEFFSV